MVEAVALGSILASGATATGAVSASTVIAGGTTVLWAGGGASTFGGLTMGALSTGLSVASTALSGFQQFQQMGAAADAERMASQDRARELSLANKRERTQSAIEEAERQRRLRRALAAQRARFAGAGIDYTTGSPVVIQDQTAGQINRESRIAKLKTDLTISSTNRQKQQELRAGSASGAALDSKSQTGLIGTLSGVGGQVGDLRELL